MLIFTKYSNERSTEFRIRTDIRQDENGLRRVQKRAAHPQAWKHVQKIYERSLMLKRDLKGTGLAVNDCELCSDGVCFPYLQGETLEEQLDQLLKQKKPDDMLELMDQYFAAFTENGVKEFQATPEFVRVFGPVRFERKQYSRSVSDIDMIFSNAICRESGYELIDYEWTFDFPVPVKFIVYRCLYYYVYGNAARHALTERNLFERFAISAAEQQQFEAMEKRFQRYILGDYTPIWMQYEDISAGMIDAREAVHQESERKRCRKTEIFLDDGRGFGIWNCRRYEVAEGERFTLELDLPPGTRAVRIDPCTGKSIVRLEELKQNGKTPAFACNGTIADNGDLIFDTEDPQIIFETTDRDSVSIRFLAEPLGNLGRELVLNQHGRIRWMEQTKVWKLYQKIKGKKI